MKCNENLTLLYQLQQKSKESHEAMSNSRLPRLSNVWKKISQIPRTLKRNQNLTLSPIRSVPKGVKDSPWNSQTSSAEMLTIFLHFCFASLP